MLFPSILCILYIWVQFVKFFINGAIKEDLDAIEKLIPVEFTRKTRSLDDVSRIKATECRLLLLYVLPIILKHRLPEQVYQHFMLLHIAIRILSCNEMVKDEDNIEYANQLLILFVEQSPEIYGDSFITYNIHNLIHLADDCRRLGAIETYSCFSFENHLGKLKNLVRSSALPLEQLVNRVTELECNPPVFSERTNRETGCTKLISEHHSGPIIRGMTGVQFKRVIFRGLKFSCKSPNNCVIIQGGATVLIDNIVELFDGQVRLIGKRFLIGENLYDFNGLQSSALGVEVVNTHLSGVLESWPLNNVLSKAMKIPVIHNNSSIERFGIVSLINFGLG